MGGSWTHSAAPYLFQYRDVQLLERYVKAFLGSLTVSFQAHFLSGNPSNRTMALGFTQPLTDMRNRNVMFLGSRARPARNAANLTTICEQIVWIMWDPQHLTRLPRAVMGIDLLLAVPIAKFVSLCCVPPFRGIEPSHVRADLSCMPMENYHSLKYVPNCELNNEFMNLSDVITETASFKRAWNGIVPICFRAQTIVARTAAGNSYYAAIRAYRM
jgi:hypothetical protein